MFHECIKYIADYHINKDDGINFDVIKQEYRTFIVELLKLLERQEYSEYLRKSFYKISDEQLGKDGIIPSDYEIYKRYVIERFYENLEDWLV